MVEVVQLVTTWGVQTEVTGALETLVIELSVEGPGVLSVDGPGVLSVEAP